MDNRNKEARAPEGVRAPFLQFFRKYLGELGLSVTALIWGTGFVVTAVGLKSLSVYQIIAIRFFVGALLMSAVFFKEFKQLNKQTLWQGMVLGTIVFIGFILQTVGLQMTTPAKNAFITGVNIVIVPFISFFVGKKPMDRYGLLGSVMACLGIGLLSIERDLSMNLGDLFTLGCAFCFAFHIYYTGEFVSHGNSPALLVVVQMFTAFVLSAAFSLWQDSGLNPQPQGILAALYLGLLSTGLAFFIQAWSQKRTTPAKTAIILSMESVYGALFSILLLGERITLRFILGSLSILLGIVVTETKMRFKH